MTGKAAVRPRRQLVVCISNDGYEACLERRKIYVSLPDAKAVKHGLIRVIDESGEDYLYSKKRFRPVRLPEEVRSAVLAA
jgi:hypothetical protein